MKVLAYPEIENQLLVIGAEWMKHVCSEEKDGILSKDNKRETNTSALRGILNG